MSLSFKFIPAIGLAALLLACSEAPQGRPNSSNKKSGATSDGVGSGGGSGGDINLTCDPNAELDPGSTPLRRLSKAQYINTVKDLLGAVPAIDGILSSQASILGIGTSLSIPASSEIADYHEAAGVISAALIINKPLLQKSFNCTAGDIRACVSTATGKLATKAFRTALTAEDVNKLMALYDVGAAVSSDHGIELIVASILQSPRFLYQVEIGTSEKLGSKAVKLNDYEVATRLAFALWDSAPDDRLLAAAAAGKLKTKAGVQEQITWMMADPKGKTLMRRFFETWSRVDDFAFKGKDAAIYPEWNDSLKGAIRAQATAFFENIVNNEGGSLNALLTSKTVMFNKDIASYYGQSSPDLTFKAFLKNDPYTSGILSLPALLSLNGGTNRSSPTNRGKFVREALLCQHLGTVPADVVNSIDPAITLPTRDAIQQTTASPRCAGCHKLMDPIGFAFENYDSIGRFRTIENGVTIDASGEIFSAQGIEGKINGLAELGSKLAKSEELQDCMVKQVFRFVKARLEESPDACSIVQSTSAFKASGAKLNSLPAAIIGHESILYRHPIN